MRSLPQIIAFYLLLALTWLAYAPGLSGDFLFDDFGNLPVLGATGPIDNASAFARYITSGNADVTGRPIALATFLFDAQDWPAPPAPFKRTNVLIHLLNGALLTWALLLLSRALLLPERKAQKAAIVGASVWLLHPFFVSTTLYVIQREAMLPATFTLMALIGWAKGRGRLLSGSRYAGLTTMWLTVLICTPLAVLSKANGALLPLLLLVVDLIVLAPANNGVAADLMRTYRRTMWLLLAVPSVLLIAWLLLKIPSSIQNAAEARSWTVYQRLLSEPRIIVEYLARLAVPRSSSRGLFNDAIVASTNPFHPWTTLPSAVLVAGLIVASFRLRRAHPALAAAVLFYFAGHLVESTWIPLELYYEHRNYLPAALMFWPLAIALVTAQTYPRILASFAAALLVLLACLTHAHAAQWGNGLLLAEVWASGNPTSTRAQASAAQYELAHGRPDLAIHRLRSAIDVDRNDIQVPINLIGAECKLGRVRPETIQATTYALSHATTGSELTYSWFTELLSLARNHTCAGVNLDTAAKLLRSAQSNPRWQALPGKRQDLDHLQGMLELNEGLPAAALDSFNRALVQQPGPGIALEQAALLGSFGSPQQGLDHLAYFRTMPPAARPTAGMPLLHDWILRKQHYWAHELTHLQATLTADVDAKHEK